MRLPALTLALFALSAPLRAQPTNPGPEMAIFIERINVAGASGNAAALAALWSDNGEYYYDGRLVARGQAELREMFRSRLASGRLPRFTHESAGGMDWGADYVAVEGIYQYKDSAGTSGRVGYAGMMRRTPTGLVAHRLIEFHERGLTARGVGQPADVPDAPSLAALAGAWELEVDETPMGLIRGALVVREDGTGLLSLNEMEVRNAPVTRLAVLRGELTGKVEIYSPVAMMSFAAVLRLSPAKGGTLVGVIDVEGQGPFPMSARRNND